MLRCSACGQTKPEGDFYRRPTARGFTPRCSPCIRSDQGDLRATNAAWLADYLAAHPCVDCGEADIIVLDFDHVRGTKHRNVKQMLYFNLRVIIAEVAKCEVRCANCHRRVTHQRRLLV